MCLRDRLFQCGNVVDLRLSVSDCDWAHGGYKIWGNLRQLCDACRTLIDCNDRGRSEMSILSGFSNSLS